MTKRVLVTCPPMLGLVAEFKPSFDALGWKVDAPPVKQTLSEEELEKLLPEYDGWIAGDDPVNRRTLAAGMKGRLRGVVKWGVGVDNVDFAAAKDLGMPVKNTPGVFGEEVADLALGYAIALAREFVAIDRGVRAGGWPKPQGVSLRGKTVLLAGFGNIGQAAAVRLAAVGLRVLVHDPFVAASGHEKREFREALPEADLIVLTCPLTPETRHMLDSKAFARVKRGVRIVNVARGPLIDERALVEALRDGRVHSAALDVFEDEPLPAASPLRGFDRCVFGSHNASNTREGAIRASERAIEHLAGMLRGGGA